MQDVREISATTKPVVAMAIGVPVLVFAGYVACLILPVIARLVAVEVVRAVTGA
jgi:hypothetical protein